MEKEFDGTLEYIRDRAIFSGAQKEPLVPSGRKKDDKEKAIDWY